MLDELERGDVYMKMSYTPKKIVDDVSRKNDQA
jgi:hypothetical protein